MNLDESPLYTGGPPYPGGPMNSGEKMRTPNPSSLNSSNIPRKSWIQFLNETTLPYCIEHYFCPFKNKNYFHFSSSKHVMHFLF